MSYRFYPVGIKCKVQVNYIRVPMYYIIIYMIRELINVMLKYDISLNTILILVLYIQKYLEQYYYTRIVKQYNETVLVR